MYPYNKVLSGLLCCDWDQDKRYLLPVFSHPWCHLPKPSTGFPCKLSNRLSLQALPPFHTLARCLFPSKNPLSWIWRWKEGFYCGQLTNAGLSKSGGFTTLCSRIQMLNRGSGRICEAYPYTPSGFKMLLHAPQTERLLSHMPSLCKSTCRQQLLRLLFGITEKQEHTKRLSWVRVIRQGTLLRSCFSCNQWLVPWESS